MNVPRIVGVPILITALYLQIGAVAEAKEVVVSAEKEEEYRRHTVFGNFYQDSKNRA